MRVFTEKCAKDENISFFEHKYSMNSRTISREQRLNMRHQKLKRNGISILPWCGYADDLILFMLDHESLQRATVLLDTIFNKFGLSINSLKTETMIINRKYVTTDDYSTSIVSLKDTPLKNVEKFKYLGSYLSNDEPSTGDVELNHRIQVANVKFSEMSNLLQNRRIHIRTRIIFLNSFVRSRLTYSCQNWNLNSHQYEHLDVVYRLFLRRMIRGGFKRVDEEENQFKFKITNEKLHNICGTYDVSYFIRRQQSNYASHLIRTSMERSTKKLLFNDDKYSKVGRTVPSLLEQVVLNNNTTVEQFCNNAMSRHGNRLHVQYVLH